VQAGAEGAGETFAAAVGIGAARDHREDVARSGQAIEHARDAAPPRVRPEPIGERPQRRAGPAHHRAAHARQRHQQRRQLRPVELARRA